MHASAHSFFGIGGPVFAVQSDENRGVGDGHRGFEHEDVELFAGFVDLRDDFFVRDGFDLVVGEGLSDLGAVGGGSGGVVIWNEGEFGIHIDERANVNRVVDGVEDVAEDLKMGSAGFDGLDTGRGLEGVGGIHDKDPVAMAEEGHGLGDARFPVGSCCLG